MKSILFLIAYLAGNLVHASSQSYHAIHGSSYAGSLGVANNPASIVNTAYPWDINLFSIQETASTNAISVLNYSLLSIPSKSQYRINKGDFERYGRGNFNVHLLNARIALNRKSGIAIGVNLRGYADINTSRYNFADTLKTLRNFLKINENNNNLHASLKSSNWLEIYGTYARTLWDNDQSRLNAGITVKATCSIAGAFADLQGAVFTRAIQNNKPVYYLKAGNIKYGYSSNIDEWTNSKSPTQNISDLLTNSQVGVSLDLGLEYIIKQQTVSSFSDGDSYYDYEWKVGISLLDFGASKYNYSMQSRAATDLKVNFSDTSLQRKFNSIHKIQSFNDTVATVFGNVEPLSGNFNIINPARLVINVDRYLFGDFYLNGEISANLSPLAGPDKLYSAELNFITVTPRWETISYGLYFPVQINAEHQFWIGGALKVGPLLLGVHNLKNIFSKNSMQKGGGYVALILRSTAFTKARHDKKYDCPK